MLDIVVAIISHLRLDRLEIVIIVLKLFCFRFIHDARIDDLTTKNANRADKLSWLNISKKKGANFCMDRIRYSVVIMMPNLIKYIQLKKILPPSFNRAAANTSELGSTYLFISLSSLSRAIKRNIDPIPCVIRYSKPASPFFFVFSLRRIGIKLRVFISISIHNINQLVVLTIPTNLDV